MADRERNRLNAGVAEVDITPPVGVELAGGAFGPARGVLHPLKARALVLESGPARLVLISCDLLGFDADYATAVRRDVAAACETPPEAVMLAATHTHGGPATMTLRNWGRPDEAYRTELAEKLVAAASRAWADAERARAGAASIACPGVTVNRVLGEVGPTDDRLGLVRIDREGGGPLAVLVDFACHPVNLHSTGLITPDFPHFVEAELRRGLGPDVAVLYLTGAAGDLNPANFGPDRTEARACETAGRIAAAALDVFPAIRPDASPRLAHATAEVEVPLAPLPPAEELAAMALEARRLMDEMPEKSATNWDYAKYKTRAEWAEEARRTIESGRTETARRVPLQAFAIGDAALVGLPGEPFAELGLEVARSRAFAEPMVVALANGAMGYFPTRAAYERRSYEAVHCPRYLGVYAFAPGVCERLAEACRSLLSDLAASAGSAAGGV